MMFVSFYWASIGQPNLVRFGNAAGTSFIFTANGCDLAPACGNPLDRYITFDFRNAGGASSIRFWAGNEYQDFNVLNLTYGVPEPATWALMLLGFAGLGFMAIAGRRRARRCSQSRRARRAKQRKIRRLQAIMPRHQAMPIRRGPGCLWAKAGAPL
jgi:hypothetical protein